MKRAVILFIFCINVLANGCSLIKYQQPNLIQVWGLSKENIYVIGKEGTLLNYNGKDWKKINVVPDDFAYDEKFDMKDNYFVNIIGTHANDLYISTINKNTYRYNGFFWYKLHFINPYSFIHSSIVQDNKLFFATAVGQFCCLDGEKWELNTYFKRDKRIREFITYNGELLGVNRKGDIFLRKNKEWEKIVSCDLATKGRTITSLCSTAENIYVVGYLGIYKKEESQLVQLFNSGSKCCIFDVWGSANTAYAVGSYGSIFKIEGDNVTRMQSPTTEHLGSIWGTGNDNIYTVGENGVLLHYDGMQWKLVDWQKMIEQHDD